MSFRRIRERYCIRSSTHSAIEEEAFACRDGMICLGRIPFLAPRRVRATIEVLIPVVISCIPTPYLIATITNGFASFWRPNLYERSNWKRCRFANPFELDSQGDVITCRRSINRLIADSSLCRWKLRLRGRNAALYKRHCPADVR